MNKILVYRNEEKKVMFKIEDKAFEINYDGFEKLIDTILASDITYEVEGDDELEEYKKLIEGIILGVNTEDFKNAVTAAKSSRTNLGEAEKRMEEEINSINT